MGYGDPCWEAGDDTFRGTGHVRAGKIYQCTRIVPMEFKRIEHHINV